MSPKEDKRATGQRARVELDVDLSTYGKYYLSKLENVSIGGAFVRTRQIHPIGTDVQLRFRLPDAEHLIQALGEVVWTYDQAGRAEPNSSGMGIRFKEIRNEDRELIAGFVERITED